jgi:hypothetical protein
MLAVAYGITVAVFIINGFVANKSTMSSGVFTGGLVGVQPPSMTGPTKIFSIEFNMIYSVLCVIYAVSLAQ